VAHAHALANLLVPRAINARQATMAPNVVLVRIVKGGKGDKEGAKRMIDLFILNFLLQIARVLQLAAITDRAVRLVVACAPFISRAPRVTLAHPIIIPFPAACVSISFFIISKYLIINYIIFTL
jgi:hypothetical protein